MSHAAPHLLDAVTIDYGPIEALSEFFLSAERAARRRGVRLEFHDTFDAYIETNRANLDTWHPTVPIFDPAFGGLSRLNSFCILGRNAAGEVVAAQAGRIYFWTDTHFRAEAESLRLFYPVPQLHAEPGQVCMVSAESAEAITGRVYYSGGGWYRPDYRKIGLSTILPRLSRVLALTRWWPDFTVSITAEHLVTRGTVRNYGYRNIEFAVDLYGFVGLPHYHGALVWMDRDEVIGDMQAFLRRERKDAVI